eukprot:TRINITY_DN29660_c0_g1_i2.p1 TRINITY_DN29660_c0_g1~~TRINITY_DN29660_c0_g1_i2.p1  ORF type:complete len:283 (-),score=27.57 TRINITY_DN29660_c0_g1_i2:239-970(-)
MRRRPGIQGLQRDNQTREQYKVVGEQLLKDKLANMRDQYSKFKSSLEDFALKYKQEIRSNPQFRAQFHTMCSNIGVDPLSSNKGMWAQLLGFGDFYYELGVQIVEACMTTREVNGGLMDLQTLRKYVLKRRGSKADPVSEDDIIRAIKKLKVLGGGFDIVKIGDRSFVRSVPGELNLDKNKIIELAQEKGFVSVQMVQTQVGWDVTRITDTLLDLLKEGLAMVDDGAEDGIRLYWFPCMTSLS